MADQERWQELGQQLRVDSGPRRSCGGLGPPDVVDVGGRPDGRPPRQVPPLRLRPAREPGERPPDLLQGPRLATASTPSSRRPARSPTSELLTFRKLGSRLEGHPTPVLPWVDVATGSLGPGPADRRRRRARRQGARPAALPRLGALRRQRDGGGLDVGGLRARVQREARQPDGDHRRQPPRAARRDHAWLGSRLVRPPGRGLRLARDCDRRPRRRGHRRGLRGGARGRGAPDRDRRPHPEGQGREGGRGHERLCTGSRSTTRRPPWPSWAASAT